MSENQNDGRFDLYYRAGWAHLTVYPPSGAGREVYHEDIQSRMKILGVPRVDAAKLREIIEAETGTPVPLVEWPEGGRLASVISVEVDADAMGADVSITAPKKGAVPPTVDEVIESIETAGVIYGVDRDLVRDLLHESRFDQRVRIANGTPAVDAESGRIIYHFDPDRGKPFMIMEFDRINLRELNFIENVEADDLLAELAPPVQPRDGRTVLGAVVPARTDTEQVRLTPGPNTELRDNGTRIFATDSGNVRERDGTIVVEPVVIVKDVDYRTGNIAIDGSVVVEQSVADGFTVEATGDIQVGQGVGRATIVAGGNVLLKTGMNGGGEGRVEASGHVLARYVEGATVVCHGHMLVEEAIMHSRVSVWGHCALNGKRSEIIASHLMVGGSVWCKKLGSVAEAAVTVEIGVPPELVEAHHREHRLHEEAQERRDVARRQLEQIISATRHQPEDTRLLQARDQIEAELAELSRSLPDMHRQLVELRDRLTASRDSLLVVEDTIFSGARVAFGMLEYHATELGARKTILRVGPAGLIEEGYNRSSSPKLDFGGELPSIRDTPQGGLVRRDPQAR